MVSVLTTIAWVALLALAVALEAAAHLGLIRLSPLAHLARRWWTHPLGRLALLCAWSFVGIHLFSRYTVPR